MFQKPVPEEIPDNLRTDFIEARLVLEYSPKASAALSRRVLQSLIRDKEGISKKNLYKEIDELLKLNKLPSYLADVVDGIRHYGNFAAHPSEDSVTGEIIEVEPGEAEWMLEILDDLFDFYFGQPKKVQERKDSLNK